MTAPSREREWEFEPVYHNYGPHRAGLPPLVPRSPIGSARDPDARTVSRAPTVRYEVAGTSYEYTAAHGRFRQTLRIGDPVTVLYDPAHPSVARIRGEGKVLVPVITSGFVLSALLVALVLLRTRRLGADPVRPRPADQLDGASEAQDQLR